MMMNILPSILDIAHINEGDKGENLVSILIKPFTNDIEILNIEVENISNIKI